MTKHSSRRQPRCRLAPHAKAKLLPPRAPRIYPKPCLIPSPHPPQPSQAKSPHLVPKPSRVDRSLHSRLGAPYAKGMGIATRAAASVRLQALVASAVAVQRAARVLVARRRISRRRESIAALQAFYRGCRARWALSTALEEAQSLRLRPRGGGGGGRDGAGEGEGSRATTSLPLSLQGKEGAMPGNELLVGHGGSMQVGKITRRDVPMDADRPEGFGPPNLAAFLWESPEEAYGPGFGAEDAGTAAPTRAPHSEGEDHRSCVTEEGGNASDDENDGAVFELSANAVISTTSIRENDGKISSRAIRASCSLDERGGKPPCFTEPSCSPTAPAQQQQLPLRWTPVAVAPREALERALRCSTLIVNSPSFDSACARRLLSRIGRPFPRPSSPPRGRTAADRQRTTPSTVSPSTTKRLLQPQLRAEPGGKPGDREGFSSALASEENMGEDQTSWRHLQGAGLRHIMLVGESPIGDGGLSELSSAVRCRFLPRLTTLVIGGPGCRVGPRGVMALALALSSPGCSQLRNLVSKEPGGTKGENSVGSRLREKHSSWACLFEELRLSKQLYVVPPSGVLSGTTGNDACFVETNNTLRGWPCDKVYEVCFYRPTFSVFAGLLLCRYFLCTCAVSQSMSNCCLGGKSWLARKNRRQQHYRRRNTSRNQARAPTSKTVAATHAAWDCFFRHLQRLPSLSTLSLQRCGLEDRDVRSLSVSLQILPAGRMRCLRLNGNCVGLSGLRMVVTALTSRRMRLPALWLRGQRPALAESGAKGVVEEAFRNGLFAEVGRAAWTWRAEIGWIEPVDKPPKS